MLKMQTALRAGGDLMTGLTWCLWNDLVVACIEILRESSTPRHSKLCLAVTIIHCRIKNGRLTINRGYVAAPKIPVQHTWFHLHHGAPDKSQKPPWEQHALVFDQSLLDSIQWWSTYLNSLKKLFEVLHQFLAHLLQFAIRRQ